MKILFKSRRIEKESAKARSYPEGTKTFPSTEFGGPFRQPGYRQHPASQEESVIRFAGGAKG